MKEKKTRREERECKREVRENQGVVQQRTIKEGERVGLEREREIERA